MSLKVAVAALAVSLLLGAWTPHGAANAFNLARLLFCRATAAGPPLCPPDDAPLPMPPPRPVRASAAAATVAVRPRVRLLWVRHAQSLSNALHIQSGGEATDDGCLLLAGARTAADGPPAVAEAAPPPRGLWWWSRWSSAVRSALRVAAVQAYQLAFADHGASLMVDLPLSPCGAAQAAAFNRMLLVSGAGEDDASSLGALPRLLLFPAAPLAMLSSNLRRAQQTAAARRHAGLGTSGGVSRNRRDKRFWIFLNING